MNDVDVISRDHEWREEIAVGRRVALLDARIITVCHVYKLIR